MARSGLDAAASEVTPVLARHLQNPVTLLFAGTRSRAMFLQA